MKYIQYIFALGIFAFLSACNLTNDIEIELPAYEAQPAVECYLEPGKPFRALLSTSYSFFDPLGLDSSFLEKTLLQGATINITYDGQTVELANQFSFDLSPLKLFNYTSTEIVSATPNINYTLNITLANGKKITGTTTMLPVVPIDSIVVNWNPDNDTLARVLTYITDNKNTNNFYRRMLNYGSLDSLAEQDFLASDRFSTTPSIAFGTGYDLTEGDTIINTIFHISSEYNDFIESVQLSVQSAGNPFSQPSPIKSNVRGDANPLGIFTSLVYDRRVTIIKK